MQRQNRPLILMFIIAVCICILKSISLVGDLHEYGIKFFFMVTPFYYLQWVVLLSFIHLYIHNNFYAWYIPLIPILAFLQWALFAEMPSDHPHMSEWHFRAIYLVFFLSLLAYMLLNYKAYKEYTSKHDSDESENLTQNDEELSGLNITSQNPIRGVFNIAIMILIFNGFSLAGNLYEKGISEALLNMSFLSIWFWLIDLVFIYLYLKKNYFAWHLAMLGTVSMLIIILFEKSNVDYIFSGWQLKLLSFVLWLAAVGYLFVRWKPYKSYVNNSIPKSL